MISSKNINKMKHNENENFIDEINHEGTSPCLGSLQPASYRGNSNPVKTLVTAQTIS